MINLEKNEIKNHVEKRYGEREYWFNILSLAIAFIAIIAFSFMAYAVEVLAEDTGARLEFDDYKMKGDCFLTWGASPKLFVTGEDVYVDIEDMISKEITRYLVDAEREISFCEGKYRVEVYEKTNKDEKEAVKGFPVVFLYDNTPPYDLNFEIEKNGNGRICDTREDYKLFTNEAVIVKAKAWDSLSGLDHIVWITDSARIEGPAVEIKGSVKMLGCIAVDECGNESSEYYCDTPILVDRQNPQVHIENENGEKELDIDIELKDEGSGIYEFEICLNDENLKSDSFKAMGQGIYSREYHLTIDKAQLIEKKNTLEVQVSDFAGNRVAQRLIIQLEDDESPVIEIAGIRDGEITNQPVSLQVSIRDENLDKDSIIINSIRTDYKGICEEINYTSEDELIFAKDGHIALQVQAKDRFGNTAYKQLEFVLDTMGPEIHGLQAYEGECVEEFFINESFESMFLDETVVQAEFYLNGRNFAPDSRITKEGDYTLKVIASDQMFNSSEKTVRFTVSKNLELNRGVDEAVISVVSALQQDKISPKAKAGLESININEKEYSENVQEEFAEEEGEKHLSAIVIFILIVLILSSVFIWLKKGQR